MAKWTFSTRCTREEYMEFYVRRHKTTHIPLMAGVVLLVGAVGMYLLQRQGTQMGLLLVLLGLIGVTLEGLWLPLFRRGEAARRYDASDSLQQAVRLSLEEDGTITVETACLTGHVPLSMATAVEETDGVLAIVFGKELQIIIPKRAFEGEEETVLRQALRKE